MKDLSQAFKELHHTSDPLLIGNVWNAQSAKIFEKQGFKAIATSSAAVAETLGYQDGQEMSFDEYVFVVKRIVKSTAIPVSVDLESGYGKTPGQIARNIIALHEIGVVGVNIEDSGIADGKRIIADAAEFASTLKQVVGLVNGKGHRVFINLRSDPFLLGLTDPVKETKRRLAFYENIGVDGLFLPCVTKLQDIEAIVAATKLPLNVMCMPDLPDFDTLRTAGVKRISMGNFLNKNVYQHLEKATQKIVESKSFSTLFA